jgi:hypothetical protein
MAFASVDLRQDSWEARTEGLERLSIVFHAFAMTGCAPSPWTGQTGRTQQPPQSSPADDDPFGLRQQLDEMAVVGARIARRGQLQDACPRRLRQAPRRGSPTVAMHQADRTLESQRAAQSADGPDAHGQQFGRLLAVEFSDEDPGQEHGPLLFGAAHRDRLPHSPTVTKSLSS